MKIKKILLLVQKKNTATPIDQKYLNGCGNGGKIVWGRSRGPVVPLPGGTECALSTGYLQLIDYKIGSIKAKSDSPEG